MKKPVFIFVSLFYFTLVNASEYNNAPENLTIAELERFKDIDPALLSALTVGEIEDFKANPALLENVSTVADLERAKAKLIPTSDPAVELARAKQAAKQRKWK